MFKIQLPFGNPNFGSTPVMLAAVFLPWPVGVITGIIKGIGVSIWTGKVFARISSFILSYSKSFHHVGSNPLSSANIVYNIQRFGIRSVAIIQISMFSTAFIHLNGHILMVNCA
jgi:thiamine transporter ThiT